MEMGSSSAITADKINRRVGSAANWDNQGAWLSVSRSLDLESDLDDGFHIFSMNWTPENIDNFINCTINPAIRNFKGEFNVPDASLPKLNKLSGYTVVKKLSHGGPLVDSRPELSPVPPAPKRPSHGRVPHLR